MGTIGFKFTEWFFFFNKDQKEALHKILTSEKNKDIKHEFLTWKLITVILPVVTFIFAFVFNLGTDNFTSLKLSAAAQKILLFFNNGSLPIISFGILTSGMPYLLEQLKEYPEYHTIRRRVMAASLIFLFLSASLYIIQTLHILNAQLNLFANILVITTSIYIFFFACSIGFKMYLLQSSNISDYIEDVKEDLKPLYNSTDDIL